MSSDTIGYLSVTEADDLVRQCYPGGDPRLTLWLSACDSDKLCWLAAALESIESQRFAGYKLKKDQPLSFPRTSSVSHEQALADVQKAQALEASERAATGSTAEKRSMLRVQGVSAFGAGSIAERYQTIGFRPVTLISLRANAILSQYSAGVARFA